MKKAASLTFVVGFLLLSVIRARANTLTGTVIITSGGWASLWPQGDTLDIRAPGFRAYSSTIASSIVSIPAWPQDSTYAFEGAFPVPMNSSFLEYCGYLPGGSPSGGYYDGVEADCVTSPNGILFSASFTTVGQDPDGRVEASGRFTAHGEIIGWTIGSGDPHGCFGCTEAFDVEVEGQGTAVLTDFYAQSFHGMGLAFEQPSPTPEPPNILLVATGIITLALLVRARTFRLLSN